MMTEWMTIALSADPDELRERMLTGCITKFSCDRTRR
jgi:hypothetical protein